MTSDHLKTSPVSVGVMEGQSTVLILGRFDVRFYYLQPYFFRAAMVLTKNPSES